MYGGCTADVPEDAVRTPYRCRTDTVRAYGGMYGAEPRIPYGYRTDAVRTPYGRTGDVRRGTADGRGRVGSSAV